MSVANPPSPVSGLEIARFVAPALLVAVWRLVSYPFRSIRGPNLYNDVLHTAIRSLTDRFTIRMARKLLPSTSALYEAECKNRRLEPNTIYVEDKNDKVAAHWVGNPNAEVVVLYFHGGGYAQPANKGVFAYAHKLVHDLNSDQSCRFIAVLVLAYSLIPEAAHPTQLRQATLVLMHLLKSGRSPSDIIIAGDSAGGNLVLALLSHLLHPHPEVPPVALGRPLAGALLYSPWTAFSTEYSSYSNEQLDMISPIAMRRWAAMLMNKADLNNLEIDPGQVSGDAWIEACSNDSSWWNGLHRKVNGILVSYGSSEVLADPIRELKAILSKGWADGGGDPLQVVFVEGHREAHIAPIVDVMAPFKNGKSDTQVAIEEWYKFRLAR